MSRSVGHVFPLEIRSVDEIEEYVRHKLGSKRGSS